MPLPPPADEPSTPTPRPTEPLTRRELEVLALVATGTTNADISRRLHVSLATVKSHLFNAYRKLGVANRVEATRIYLEQHDDQAPHRPLLDRTATTTLGSATPDLLPHEIDRHLEVLAGVSAETERLRRRLEALRSARTGHDKRS